MKLSVVIPAYNEIDTIDEIIKRVRSVPIDKEIIIIDNCSTDGTRRRVKQLAEDDDVTAILQQRNMRKGNSVKKGIAAANGNYIVIQDADLEYDPSDYTALLAAAADEDAHAVIGSRVAGDENAQSQQAAGGGLFAIGRQFLNSVFRLLNASKLTDIASCYKLASRNVFQTTELHCDGFDLDYEIAARWVLQARREGKYVAEVPIGYSPRSVAEGKKIRWRDGIAALWAIIKYRFIG